MVRNRVGIIRLDKLGKIIIVLRASVRCMHRLVRIMVFSVSVLRQTQEGLCTQAKSVPLAVVSLFPSTEKLRDVALNKGIKHGLAQ